MYSLVLQVWEKLYALVVPVRKIVNTCTPVWEKLFSLVFPVGKVVFVCTPRMGKDLFTNIPCGKSCIHLYFKYGKSHIH